MTEKIHPETIHRLLEIERDDAETIELLVTALESFEKYHQAIYRLEIQRKLYSCGAMDSETYRDLIPRLDSIRTQHHNAMLSEVRLLNRLAEQHGLPPFYEGEVSEAAPDRTWVADAVLDYVHQVILGRVTGGR